MQRYIKVIAIVLLVYAGIVVAFESLIGYFQPSNEATLTIITTDDDGTANDRVLARMEYDDTVYVSANHWPRAWYRQALENPNVEVVYGGVTRDYLAVPVSGEEHDRVEAAHPHPGWFRFVTGYPPRYFLRLESPLEFESAGEDADDNWDLGSDDSSAADEDYPRGDESGLDRNPEREVGESGRDADYAPGY